MIKLIVIAQIICIFMVGAGIWIEFTYEADIGFILISGGSLAFAVSTKLSKIKLLRIIEYLTKQMEDPNDV